MPHGAGHIGGGHHGGGFHHHHHHHHGGFNHHHHNLGHHHNRGWWYWGGPYTPYGYGYRRCRVGFIALFISVIFIVGVPVSTIVGLNYATSSYDTDGMEEYALTDKILLNYNSHFCQEIKAQSTKPPLFGKSNATLYTLTSPPPLSDVERFNLSETAYLTTIGDYKQWNFFLNSGSYVFLNVCLPSNSYSGTTFYLIEGSDNFNRWKGYPYDYYVLSQFVSYGSPCTTISYNVTEDSKYYFAFYMDEYIAVDVNVAFQFQRRVYHIAPDTILQNCSFHLDGYSDCSVGVPLSSNYSVVLSLNSSLPVNYDTGASVSISCQPRIWLYAMIVVAALVPLLLIFICVIACVCVYVKRGNNKYTPLVGNNATTGNVTGPPAAAINVVTTNNSPPGSAYPPPSGGYGATSGAPPPYATVNY